MRKKLLKKHIIMITVTVMLVCVAFILLLCFFHRRTNGIIPDGITEIKISGYNISLFSYTDEKKIAEIVDYLNSPETLGLKLEVYGATATGCSLYFEVSPIRTAYPKGRLQTGEEFELDVEWTDVYGELPEGRYCIRKTVTDYVDDDDQTDYELYAEFTVTCKNV